MALETLKGIKTIGGFDVVDMDALKDEYPEKFTEQMIDGIPTSRMDWKWFEEEIRPNKFIYVRHDVNSLSFTIQNQPIKEVGVNGCQVDTIIEVAKTIIEGLNNKFPCRENSLAITKLDEALMWLRERTLNRIKRNVEGLSKE